MTRVIAALLVENNKILIAQRNSKDPLAKLWEFPGGKVESGETDQDCLHREMKEEFNINTDVGVFFGESLYESSKNIIDLWAYWCTWVDGEITAKVHDDYKWATVDELDDYIFAPADIPLVDKLRREYGGS